MRGCLDGLLVTFDDTFKADESYEIVLSQANQAMAVITCTLAPKADSPRMPSLSCSSASRHSASGRTLHLPDATPGPIQISVSTPMGGRITDQRFDVVFTALYPNGEGCGGACRQASLSVTR